MKSALVLGSADCLFHDAQAVARWAHETRPLTIAVNDAGWVWPGRVDHWVTLHAENLPALIAKRPPDGYETWSRPKDDGIETDHRLHHWGVGSSGLFAVTVALHLGCEKVVLCGMPMDSRPYAMDHDKWVGAWPSSEVEIHRDGWTYHLSKMKGHVKSLSGWTRELLGAPTEEWLYAE